MKRFDLNIPEDIAEAIEKMATEKAIPPRVLGRSLLVEKVKELSKDESDGNIEK
ncbi:MAG: hypothetical protein KKA79_04495 [Nanoarchaeota archaeon]|nr:hypothetical protein [Nanoarchaeota archaeon]